MVIGKYQDHKGGLVGHSFNACMKSIQRGEVKPEQVVVIITSTAFKTREDFARALEERYLKYYRWDVNSVSLALRFWDEGRIVQPRLRNPNLYTEYEVDKIWTEVKPEGTDL